jgi:hypothetical protein
MHLMIISAVADTSRRRRSLNAAASYLGFILVASLYLFPFMRVVLPHTNEGSLISGAERIARGDVFARDFFEVIGPGTFYIVAVFFKVLGVSFLATRIWLFLSSLGTAACIYFLTRRLTSSHRLLPCVVAAGTSFGMQWPSITHHLDSNLFGLIAIAGLVLWDERRHHGLLYGSGLFIAIVAWIHPPKGFFLLLGVLGWLLLHASIRGARVAACRRVLTGFSIVCLAGGAYFYSRGALASLYYANVTWPAHNYGAINHVPYALGTFREYWRHWAMPQHSSGYWTIALATFLIIPFIFVAILPLILFLSASRLKTWSSEPILLLYVLSGWALWLSEIHRADIYHIVFGSPLLLIVGVRMLSDSGSRISRCGIQLLAVSACCLMITNLLQVVTAKIVPTRVGPVGMLQPDPVAQFVSSRVTPGHEVFFYPYCPMEYFLTLTKNPTRFSILVYEYNTPAEFDEVTRVLEQRQVKYLVWDRSFEDHTFKAVFPGVTPIAPSERIIEPYIKAHYSPIAVLNDYQIMMRNE